MSSLVTALLAEGVTDGRFLPRIIERTADDLLLRYGRRVIDILPLRVLPSQPGPQVDRILAAAGAAYGSHILFVHADADAPGADAAYAARIAPGVAAVRAAHTRGQPVCTDIVPVVPVQMTEAWLLADAQALRDVLGSDLSNDELQIPLAAEQIEALGDPKARLAEIARRVTAHRPQRRRRIEVGTLYEPLADRLALDRLARLPAYRAFRQTFSDTLAALNFFH